VRSTPRSKEITKINSEKEYVHDFTPDSSTTLQLLIPKYPSLETVNIEIYDLLIKNRKMLLEKVNSLELKRKKISEKLHKLIAEQSELEKDSKAYNKKEQERSLESDTILPKQKSIDHNLTPLKKVLGLVTQIIQLMDLFTVMNRHYYTEDLELYLIPTLINYISTFKKMLHDFDLEKNSETEEVTEFLKEFKELKILFDEIISELEENERSDRLNEPNYYDDDDIYNSIEECNKFLKDYPFKKVEVKEDLQPVEAITFKDENYSGDYEKAFRRKWSAPYIEACIRKTGNKILTIYRTPFVYHKELLNRVQTIVKFQNLLQKESETVKVTYKELQLSKKLTALEEIKKMKPFDTPRLLEVTCYSNEQDRNIVVVIAHEPRDIVEECSYEDVIRINNMLITHGIYLNSLLIPKNKSSLRHDPRVYPEKEKVREHYKINRGAIGYDSGGKLLVHVGDSASSSFSHPFYGGNKQRRTKKYKRNRKSRKSRKTR
jgi:hypothetical protein